MASVELGTVIAERVLHSPQLENEVRVRIGCPQETTSGDFITPYQIVGVGHEKVRFAAGLDAVQSLQLVFLIIGADLESYSLQWANPDDPGFPTP
jgi:hypothetical protein